MERNASHLVAVAHGLPREDFADEKVDVRLQLGSKSIGLQIKTEFNDAYRAEHYEKVRTKTLKAIEYQDTVLLVLDTEMLETAYRLYKRGSTTAEKTAGTRAKNLILEALSKVIPEEASGCFGLIYDGKKKVEVEEITATNFTEKFVLSVTNIPFLVNLGLLQPGVVDAVSVKRAKEVLLNNRTLLRKVFKTAEAFSARDKDCTEQMRAILAKESSQDRAA
jgi:hypothetical protein